MPGRVDAKSIDADELTPRQIVQELDRFIVGQDRAKRAVAIALRNRTRRKKLPPEMAEEVLPKNILMIGPTGVGKTEIARRLARMASSPFLKVEASKFTEVGYVGRDVESMVRDLVEIGVDMIRQERREQVSSQAALTTRRRLLDLLLPPRPKGPRPTDAAAQDRERAERESWERSRQALERQLEAGELEDRVVQFETTPPASTGMRIFGPAGMEELDMNLREMLPNLFQGKPQRRKMSVAEAREVLQREEEERLIDPDQIAREAIGRVEESGILFIDELDKIAGREGTSGPEVSREGVQRDLLPIVEGTLVNTKRGMVRTDHILFMAAGAFHVSKPSDLIPEMQGRFPIRMFTEGVELSFTEDGVSAIASAAADVNQRTENIGARRLHTVMERVLDDVSFAGPDLAGQRVVIDERYVRERIDEIASDTDLSRYIL
jgi:ATP-dependent HslUV protease ATP-binding subunit HslU